MGKVIVCEGDVHNEWLWGSERASLAGEIRGSRARDNKCESRVKILSLNKKESLIAGDVPFCISRGHIEFTIVLPALLSKDSAHSPESPSYTSISSKLL
jgi:hypothetical protein